MSDTTQAPSPAIPEKILVVEDEEDILELIRYNLEKANYRVALAETGEAALEKARAERPDLILLDLMLPGIDGLEVCKTLKNNPHTRQTPIVMVTARGEESDTVIGLELGADDYITKPFSPKVLIARIKAVLRRRKAPLVDETGIIHRHNIGIDPARHEVLVDGKPVALTSSEFRILHALARKPGWVFTRYQIVEAVHGEGYPVTDRSVDVQISGLRKKLGSAGSAIETVRGVGYRLRE